MSRLNNSDHHAVAVFGPPSIPLPQHHSTDRHCPCLSPPILLSVQKVWRTRGEERRVRLEGTFFPLEQRSNQRHPRLRSLRSSSAAAAVAATFRAYSAQLCSSPSRPTCVARHRNKAHFLFFSLNGKFQSEKQACPKLHTNAMGSPAANST